MIREKRRSNTSKDHADDGDDAYNNDIKKTLISVSASNQLPLLTINDYFMDLLHIESELFFFACPLVSLPKLAKHQRIFFHKRWFPDESRINSEHLIGDYLHVYVFVYLKNRSP